MSVLQAQSIYPEISDEQIQAACFELIGHINKIDDTSERYEFTVISSLCVTYTFQQYQCLDEFDIDFTDYISNADAEFFFGPDIWEELDPSLRSFITSQFPVVAITKFGVFLRNAYWYDSCNIDVFTFKTLPELRDICLNQVSHSGDIFDRISTALTEIIEQ